MAEKLKLKIMFKQATIITLVLVAFVFITAEAQPEDIISLSAKSTDDSTFCNPLNLDYRFYPSTEASYREAADPMVVLFKDDYYIFASKSGGYWWSPDFKNWNFVIPTGIDIEKYAPSAWVMGDTLYYTSSENGSIYKSTDPKAGTWELVSHPHDWADPWVFVDTDGRVYVYHNCSENGTIDCIELDPNNKFKAIGSEVKCIYSNATNNGFEVNGDNNESGLPWTEGPSMLKSNGVYFLSYATPGTENRSYCDGYYTATSPMGPFTLGANSPQIHKPLGYVTGTGHGGLFYDKTGKLWAIETVSISNKAFFERRLAVFPSVIDENGMLHSNTVFGDYPQYYPGISEDPVSSNSPGWNLLSKGKVVTCSSADTANVPENAVDENIRTSWSATSGDLGEWFAVDLGKPCAIHAVQSNFYESNTTYQSGRTESFTTKYKVEYSLDDVTWTLLFDKSDSQKDTPHDYVQLTEPVTTRYVRVTNTGEIPGYGYFSLTDFRIFGNGGTEVPEAVSSANASLMDDARCVNVNWKPVPGADGYIIRYGIAADKLWDNYQVWSDTSFLIRSLIIGQTYYYRVDAYNDCGVTAGSQILTTTSTPLINKVNAFTRNEAEKVNSFSGIVTESCSDKQKGGDITQIEDGDWIMVKSVDFGDGAFAFEARVASETNGGTIELRLDSLGGKLIGTCIIEGTGGWQTWETDTCSVYEATGIHDLYMIFKGNNGLLFNFNYWKFYDTVVSVTSSNVKMPISLITENEQRYLKGVSKGDIITLYNSVGQVVAKFNATSEIEEIRNPQKGFTLIEVMSKGQRYVIKTTF